MRTKFYFLVILCVASLLTGCGKLKGCEKNGRTDYIFELPVTISPAKDTFHVGDTMWIENSYSNNLVNYFYDSHKTYDVTGVDFQTIINITNLNTPKPSYSYIDPAFITYKGRTVNDTNGSKYHSIGVVYQQESGMSVYKAAFVINKSGFYAISFSSFAEGAKTKIDKCPDQRFEQIHYPTNGNGDNNYEMLQYAKTSNFGDYSIQEFNHYGCYCFYVK